MMRLFVAGLLAAAGFFAPGAVKAQNTCPEGRTGGGQCVNASLADSMRQAAVIYSQPKLSFTHYPVLPSQDWTYRYPNQLNPNPLNPSQAGKSFK
jgi:hypothetical protein